MIWGHAPLIENGTESYDLWQYHEKNENKEFIEKICIPSKSKKKILVELQEIYNISHDNLYLKNGFLENTYNTNFEDLRKECRLLALYVTDANSLTKIEESVVKAIIKKYNLLIGRDMAGGCIRLSSIK
jgi:hypothetical protein